MAAFPILPTLIAGCIYVFFLRLSSQMMLGYKVNRKLLWIWFAIAVVISVINIAIFSGVVTATGLTIGIGFLLHIVLGGAFLGRFAVDSFRVRPGFAKGTAVVGIAATASMGIFLTLIYGSRYLLARMG